MNLANRITILRVLMIPVFIYIYLANPFGEPLSRYLALAVFLLASATDALDGYIARSRNMITNFGKLMDPLADKLLVASALIAMTQTGAVSSVPVMIIVAREFLITGFRMLAVEQGIVIAASFWAKVKTVSQIVMVSFVLLNVHELLNTVLIWIAVVFTVVSAVEYVVKNKEVIK